MPYDGFVSYSHAADGRLAPALQRGLQLLAKPWNSRRALRIFRDETGLSTNPDLWSAIERALDESEWFVLLASPEAAQSEWVNKEISRWLATKAVDHILPVVTDGTWCWDPVLGDFTAESSAAPETLRGALRDEPRHLDVRWARAETDLDLRNSRFRSAVADLAAPMHGVAKDELEGEDIRQHRRTRRLVRGAVSALALLVVISVLFGVFAVAQRNSARAATAEADQRLLVSGSQGLLGSSRQLATLLAIEADRRQPGADTRDALLNAVLAEPRLQRTFGSPAGDMAPLAGHRVAVLSKNRGSTPNRNIVQVWDWQTGRRQTWPNAPLGDADTGPTGISTTADGLHLALVSSDGMIQLYSGRTLDPQGPPFPSGLGQFPAPAAAIRLSPNGQSLAVSGYDPGVTAPYAGRSFMVFSRVGNRWVSDPPLAGHRTPVNAIAFSSDGGAIATASPTPTGSDIVINDVASGQSLLSFASVPTSSIALDWARRRVVLGLPSGGVGDAVWYDLNIPDPTPQVIDVGANGLGYAVPGYDLTDSRLGIDSSNGFGIFDGTTLTPLPNVPVLPTNTNSGPFLFLDSVHVLTATSGGGPVSLWDLSGTSVLAKRTPAQFTLGVFPGPYSGPYSDRSAGSSTLGNESSITILGPGYRSLGAPIPVDQDLQKLSAYVRNAVQTIGPVGCVDARTGRLATVPRATGDIVVRNGTPPFRVMSSAPGVAAGLADPIQCAWSPDGRQIAIGTYPQPGQVGPASVALYDVASKTLRFDESLSGEIAIVSLVYSPDSKNLWVGGPTTGSNGVYRVTDLDHTPRVSVAFPGATAISADADGQRLVVAYPNSVRAFGAHTLKPLTEPIALPTTYIFGVDSAPDGHRALVDSGQGWRLIDLDAQQATGPWVPYRLPTAALWGSNGTTVYTRAPDGGGEIWNLAPSNLRSAACGLVGRNLTEQEWQKYLSWAGPRRATCSQYHLS